MIENQPQIENIKPEKKRLRRFTQFIGSKYNPHQDIDDSDPIERFPYKNSIYGDQINLPGALRLPLITADDKNPENTYSKTRPEIMSSNPVPGQTSSPNRTSQTEQFIPETAFNNSLQVKPWIAPPPSPTVADIQTLKFPSPSPNEHHYTIPLDNTQPVIDRNALNNLLNSGDNFSDKEIKDGYAQYLWYKKQPDTPENKQKYFDALNNTKTSVSINSQIDVPQWHQPAQKDQTQYPRNEQPQDEQPQRLTNAQIATINEAAEKIAVDLSDVKTGEDPARAFARKALEQVAPRYGFTSDDIEKQLDYEKRTNGGYVYNSTTGKPADADIIREIQYGNTKLNYTVTSKQIINIINRKNGNPNADFVPSTPQEIKNREMEEKIKAFTPTDDELRQQVTNEHRKEYEEAVTNKVNGFDDKYIDQAGNFKDIPPENLTDEQLQRKVDEKKRLLPTREQIIEAINQGEEAWRWRSGFASSLGALDRTAAGYMRPFASLGWKEPYESLAGRANQQDIFAQVAKHDDNSFLGNGEDFLTGLPVNLLTLGASVELGKALKLPGGEILGFAAHSAAQSAGKGDNPSEIVRQATKGGAQGAVFGAADSINLKNKLIESITKIGAVGTGSTGVELAYGTPLPEAVKAGIVNGLFKASQESTQILGSVGRIWSKGKPYDVKVDRSGNVSLVKYKSGANPNNVDFEMMLDPEDNVYKAISIDTNGIPPKTNLSLLKSTKSQETASIENRTENHGNLLNGEIAPNTQTIVKNLDHDHSNIVEVFNQLKGAGYTPAQAGEILATEIRMHKPHSNETQKETQQEHLSATNDQNSLDSWQPTSQKHSNKEPLEYSQPVQTTPNVEQETKSTQFAERPNIAEQLNHVPSEAGNLAKVDNKPLSRDFRVGTNDTTLTFDSPIQRDLYDYYDNEKEVASSTGQRINTARVKDLSINRNALAGQLGIQPNQVFGIAKQVSEDVKWQMRGAQHLEERKVSDNILPKFQTSDNNLESGKQSYSKGEDLSNKIINFVNDAITNPKAEKSIISLGMISHENADRIKQDTGFDVQNYEHVLDKHSIKHIFDQPGNESFRRQTTTMAEDLAKIPEIVSNPDKIEVAGKSLQDRNTIKYTKSFNGDTYHVEEIRAGKNHLVPIKVYKTVSNKTSDSPTSNDQGVREKQGSNLDRTANLKRAPNSSIQPQQTEFITADRSRNKQTGFTTKSQFPTNISEENGSIIKPLAEQSFSKKEYTPIQSAPKSKLNLKENQNVSVNGKLGAISRIKGDKARVNLDDGKDKIIPLSEITIVEPKPRRQLKAGDKFRFPHNQDIYEIQSFKNQSNNIYKLKNLITGEIIDKRMFPSLIKSLSPIEKQTPHYPNYSIDNSKIINYSLKNDEDFSGDVKITMAEFVEETKPCGEIISKSFIVRKNNPRVRYALKIIDSVHGDGDLPRISITAHNSLRIFGGMYVPDWQGTSMSGILLDKDNKMMEETTIHEIGHFLDFEALGKGTQYGSENIFGLKGWWRAIANSEAISNISQIKAGQQVGVKLNNGLAAPVVATQANLNYLLNKKEIFARSYSQFIALQSKNQLLLNQIESIRNSQNYLRRNNLWQDDDFEPIYKAFLKFFKIKGWLK